MNDVAYHDYLFTIVWMMAAIALGMIVIGRDADGLGAASLMACALIATALVVSNMYPDGTDLNAVTPPLGLVPNYVGVGT